MGTASPDSESGKETLSAYLSSERVEQVKNYREQAGHDKTSPAVDDLLAAGIREKRAPVLSRLVDIAVDAAYHFGLLSIVIVIAGYATDALAPGHSIQIALVVLAVGGASLATAEVGRLATGQSEVGGALRDWRGEDQ